MHSIRHCSLPVVPITWEAVSICYRRLVALPLSRDKVGWEVLTVQIQPIYLGDISRCTGGHYMKYNPITRSEHLPISYLHLHGYPL